MKNESKQALDAYYAEADSWAKDRQDALRSSRRIAWIVAGAAAAIALFEALALVFLMPLKTAVPYTLMVDRQTGYVQELRPLDPQLVSSRSALTQSFLVQYVIAREGYNADALQSDYRKVALWSAGRARQRYIASMQASNPASPLARYPRSSVVGVQVTSVTPMGNNVAMVRFQTRRHDAGGHIGAPRTWVAVIRYTFSNKPLSVEDRYFNPLGFEVTRYNRSAETLPRPDPQGAAPEAGPADTNAAAPQ
ncbi:type IV secretion system protein [Stakelama sediminis]|uniref:Type IV secretion system protein VirB8 n=1 Tax=Stakelama sediminis TaxID=463200 RepID=A0A840Z2J7_9SPHN|nr:VirB8/TrbF family protein [Stakelama sediminis]MBB5720228.1 type IV secretion system protein VirB8 [Stakelama sediminis]